MRASSCCMLATASSTSAWRRSSSCLGSTPRRCQRDGASELRARQAGTRLGGRAIGSLLGRRTTGRGVRPPSPEHRIRSGASRCAPPAPVPARLSEPRAESPPSPARLRLRCAAPRSGHATGGASYCAATPDDVPAGRTSPLRALRHTAVTRTRAHCAFVAMGERDDQRRQDGWLSERRSRAVLP